MAHNKTKLKILYLLKMLQEETNDEHGLTMTQMLEKLAEKEILAERKSIYDDINTLREFGIDIKTYQRNPVQYAIEKRDFTLNELMLIVDAVQSCQAITKRQADSLVKAVKKLASINDQGKLRRRIHVEGRVKTKTESVLSTVDTLHEAINARRKVRFMYGRSDCNGKRLNPSERIVTPLSITYDNGLYYLTAWNDEHESTREYRLNRMTDVVVLKDTPATKNEITKNHEYTKNDAVMVNRYAGEAFNVTLEATPELSEVIYDRFGDAADIFYANSADSADSPKIHAVVRVCVSCQFFGWVAGLGNTVRIIGPGKVAEKYQEYLEDLLQGKVMSDLEWNSDLPTSKNQK